MAALFGMSHLPLRIAATPGRLFDDLQVVVISTTAPSPCSPSANSAALSSTPQVTDVTTFSPTASAASAGSTVVESSSSALAAFAALVALNYTSILQTTCANSILLSYTSVISSGTTTSFPTVGCSVPISFSAASSNPGCHLGYSTYSIASNSSICCPRLVSHAFLFVRD